MGFFSWWSALPPILRIGMGLLLIGISTALWFGGRIWIWGWIAGVICLFFGGPSSSEKKGYRF